MGGDLTLTAPSSFQIIDITHGKKQAQKQISYEVIDQYTIRATLDGKKYMLERTE